MDMAMPLRDRTTTVRCAAMPSSRMLLLTAVVALAGCRGGSASRMPPQADQYGQSAPASRLLRHESQILDDLNARLQTRDVPRALLDARLSNAAEALNTLRGSQVARDACDVGPGAVDAALRWSGVYERPACQRCFWTRKAAAVRVPDDVLQGLSECLAVDGQAGQPLLGVHTRTQDGRTFVSLVAVRRLVVVDPLARVAQPSAPVRVTGTLPEVGGPYRMLWGTSQRPVEVSPMPVDARGVFRLDLPPPPQDGHLVWSVVDGQGFERARATLRGPAQPVAGVFEDVERGVGYAPAAQAAAIRAAVDGLRKSAGLSPVRWAAALDGAAQQEANQARPVTAWAARPAEPATVESARSVGSAVRVFKLHGAGHGEVIAQLLHQPVGLHALTRPVEVSAGLGVTGVPRDGGKAGVAVVLVLATDAVGGLDF